MEAIISGFFALAAMLAALAVNSYLIGKNLRKIIIALGFQERPQSIAQTVKPQTRVRVTSRPQDRLPEFPAHLAFAN